jgi:succinylglutamate desuccinylase
MMEFSKFKLPKRTGNAAVADAARAQALREAFSQTVERIERLVDLETATLQQYRPIDFSEFNHRKSHAILELSRSIRALGSEAHGESARVELERLSGKLQRNLATLEIHLKAVRQVCSVISRAIQSEESDGTYSSTIHRRYEQS